MKRIVILMQENKTPDFYFPTHAEHWRPDADIAQSAPLAGRLDPTRARPIPPALGTAIVQPQPPNPPPAIQLPLPWGGPSAQPLPDLVANGGAKIPAPDDALVRAKPPNLPTGL
jgi:hypothetical protein